MITFRSFCFFVIISLLSGWPQKISAAETLDAAIQSMIGKFVASVDIAGGTKRVAVTPFIASNRKTTQFTNLLMIAMTGTMVELGKGKVRVIERAQLETALAEIQLSEVPIFDSSTAQELGKFLGVDVLIVGEITPLTDSVRIDARMIDVETIETVEQASEWVPLTPSVQLQLDTLAVLSRPSVGDNGPSEFIDGIWQGTGECGDTVVGLAVSMIVGLDFTVSALQTYYPTAQGGTGSASQSGTLIMEGSYDVGSNRINLAPESWLFQPRGHATFGFSGTLDTDAGTIVGTYDREGCGEVKLKRLN
jgi:TolB-like protein